MIALISLNSVIKEPLPALFALAAKSSPDDVDVTDAYGESGGIQLSAEVIGSGTIVIAHYNGKSAIFTPTGNAYYYPEIPDDEQGGWSWRNFAQKHYVWVLPSRTYMKSFDKEGEGIGSLKTKNKFLTRDKKEFPEMTFLEYLCLADQILSEKSKS